MKPAIEVARIENECSIMAASTGNLSTSGLPGDDTPEFGGENSDGSVGSRKYYSIWDE